MAKFFMHTATQGRFAGIPKLFIEIPTSDKDAVHRPAIEEDKVRYSAAYADFQAALSPAPSAEMPAPEAPAPMETAPPAELATEEPMSISKRLFKKK